MSKPGDLRTSKRVTVSTGVQWATKGKMASALAINLSMGGILISTSYSLPIGSPCRLAILASCKEGGEKLLVDGTVIRSDSKNLAIKFKGSMNKIIYNTIIANGTTGLSYSIYNTYYNYFKISQNVKHEGCTEILGISCRTFNTVFLSTFCTIFPLAIFLAWSFRDYISTVPNLLKITGSLGYAAIWLAIIQPTIDLAVFQVLKYKIIISKII